MTHISMCKTWNQSFNLLCVTRRLAGEGKSSVCLVCMKYRIIILIIIIISLGEI